MCSVEIKYELDFSDPDQEILNYAREHINERHETKAQTLLNLRNRILENGGDEITSRLDDNYLLRFLRARNFDEDKSFQLLCNYCAFKKNHPEYYSNLQFESLYAIGEAQIVNSLPFFEESGRRILLVRPGHWIPKDITALELFQAALLAADLGILEQRTQILGGIAIMDFSNIKLNHLYQFTPKIISQGAEVIMRCYPIRIHAIHVVNQNALFSAGYKLVQPFLTKDLKARIFLHGSNFTSLHEHISPNYLPKIYGGIHPEFSNQNWFDVIKENEIILNELRVLGSDLEDQSRQILGSAG